MKHYRSTKYLGYKATKNVMTDALVDAMQNSAYGDFTKWVEYVSVAPETDIDMLPQEPEDLEKGTRGEIEIYIPARFFVVEWKEKQRRDPGTSVEWDEKAIENWLNRNLPGITIHVEKLLDEGKTQFEVLDSGEVEEPIIEDFRDALVQGTVVIGKSLLSRALRRYKAYARGYKSGLQHAKNLEIEIELEIGEGDDDEW